jgi:phospholipase/lecithinase/hemolysin
MTLQSMTHFCLRAMALTFLIGVPAFAGGAPHRFVVFGDSLSDPGNYYFLYGQVSEAPFAPIPSAPYDEHGHHFTNGRTWIERLTLELDHPESGRAAFERPRINTNYAVGRARARPQAPEFASYDLGTQVAAFLTDFNGEAPGNSTYVIWIGANDLDDALSAASTDPAQSAAIIQSALAAVATNVELLWSAGARSFFVPNLPDFGLTPAVQSLGQPAIAAATELSTLYNTYLAQTLTQLGALPGIELTTLDVFAVLHGVVSDPVGFGIKDTQTPCLQFGVTVDAICDHPNKHLFWDAIHPTVAGHEALERAAEQALLTAQKSTH